MGTEEVLEPCKASDPLDKTVLEKGKVDGKIGISRASRGPQSLILCQCGEAGVSATPCAIPACAPPSGRNELCNLHDEPVQTRDDNMVGFHGSAPIVWIFWIIRSFPILGCYRAPYWGTGCSRLVSGLFLQIHFFLW